MDSLFDVVAPRPLAERLRPTALRDVVGQDHLLGPGMPLARMIAARRLSSLVLWGPPGTGKTTLARLLAREVGLEFEQISAAASGMPELRKSLEAARERRRSSGRATLLFVDEIHRWNKTQQDALLPHVEDGTVVLVGPTTENPSFSLNSALLSRVRVLRLRPLDREAMGILLQRAETELQRTLPLDEEARDTLIGMADGDGRYLLGLAEDAADIDTDRLLSPADLAAALQSRTTGHDRSGDAHHALLSALQKSIRGSDVQAALFWLARLLHAGEPPRGVLRRLVVMATEEIGMADPGAVAQAVACSDAFERLGEPEGLPAIGQAVIYLATAVKSNAAYVGFHEAMEMASRSGGMAPPPHAVNAATREMREAGVGAGYRYDHDFPEGYAGQDFFPEGLSGSSRPAFYRPNERANEREVGRRMAWWESRRGSGGDG